MGQNKQQSLHVGQAPPLGFQAEAETSIPMEPSIVGHSAGPMGDGASSLVLKQGLPPQVKPGGGWRAVGDRLAFSRAAEAWLGLVQGNAPSQLLSLFCSVWNQAVPSRIF